jgi:hypothetical protein
MDDLSVRVLRTVPERVESQFGVQVGSWMEKQAVCVLYRAQGSAAS